MLLYRSIVGAHELFDNASAQFLTNMFVFLRPHSTKHHCNEAHFQSYSMHKATRLHCRRTVINLINVNDPTVPTNCCQDLVVFSELRNLQIDGATDEIMNCEETIETAERSDVRSVDSESAPSEAGWYELDVFVAGFKDVLVQGKSIWE